MLNIKELYIIADFIETPIGKCWLTKVSDYDKLILYQEWLVKNKYDVLKDVVPKYKEEVKSILDEGMPFYEFIMTFKNFGYYNDYKEVFKFFFQEDVFDKIKNNEEFEAYRKLIRELNCINYKEKKKKSKNAKVNLFDKLEQISEEQSGELLTLKSMIANVGLYRQDVLTMSIYSLHAYFDTIGNNKNYHTGNLFKTVSTERINVKPWYFDSSIEQTKLNDEDKRIIQDQVLHIQVNKPDKIKQV